MDGPSVSKRRCSSCLHAIRAAIHSQSPPLPSSYTPTHTSELFFSSSLSPCPPHTHTRAHVCMHGSLSAGSCTAPLIPGWVLLQVEGVSFRWSVSTVSVLQEDGLDVQPRDAQRSRSAEQEDKLVFCFGFFFRQFPLFMSDLS